MPPVTLLMVIVPLAAKHPLGLVPAKVAASGTPVSVTVPRSFWQMLSLTKIV